MEIILKLEVLFGSVALSGLALLAIWGIVSEIWDSLKNDKSNGH